MLSRIGGKTVKETVRNCLYHLLDKKLALQFSFFGQKGKLSFVSLELKRVLYDAVMRYTSYTDIHADENVIKQVVMSWLKHAQDQKGGRSSRSRIEKKCNKPES